MMIPSPQAADPTIERGGAVFLIEDDADTRDAMTALLSPTAPVYAYGSAEEFLSHARPEGPACLLLDQRLPGMSGSDLLQRLKADRRSLPAVMVTGFADTPSTVEAMRNGAVTVLDKPCADAALHSAVQKAIELDRKRLERSKQREAAVLAIEKLTDNEREVLRMVLDGVPNKQISRRMGVCVRTIESRRSKIYQATRVSSVAELVRLCVLAGFVEV